MGWLAAYFNRFADMEVTQASSLSALYQLVFSIAIMVSGPLLDFIRHKWSIAAATKYQAAASLIACASILWIFRWATPGSSLQITVLIIQCFLSTSIATLCYLLVVELSLASYRATALSMLIFFQNIVGMAVGPLLAGIISDHFDLATSLYIMGGVYAISGLLYIIITITFPRDAARIGPDNVEFE